MISFNGDIVGYLASSQTNLHPPQKHTKSSSHNTTTRSPERNRSQIRLRSNKPRQVGINGDSIHRQTTAHHAGHSLQLLNLPPDLVRHSLHETVRLHEHTHRKQIKHNEIAATFICNFPQYQGSQRNRNRK